MIGQKIARYEVLELLGQGGMGLVYKARDANLDRFVALKVLHAKSVDNQDRVRRFAQEAKAASALNHPNIITVYEIDKIPGGPDFIAMEFIDGQTLHSFASQAVPIPSLISIARQTAEALTVAHSQGIVHRDIKPENIMVRRDGYVKVLDFGLARLLTEDRAALETITRATAAGLVVGTPAYMSPEQARGEALTDATDVFSLGLVLYQVATGQHPYPAASNVAILQAISSQAAVPPSRLRPEIPKPLEELILAMLDKDPVRRPRASAIVEALTASGNGSAVSPLPVVRTISRLTVGRDRELRELRSCFDAAASGNGLFLCVTGEPGIGKTALIEEFLSETADATPSVGRGRCSERLAGTEAYLPILEALEDLVRTPMGSQWAHLLKLFAPTWYVQVTLSSRDSNDQLRAEAQGASQERMKREITSFFQEISRIRPLILFFDDLHWADLSTVDILSYLGDRCRSMRLLILATYRPSDLLLNKHPFHQVKLELQGRGACREIPVGFLESSEIERYLAYAFAGHRFPPGFAHMVRSRTEGNPLFMVDLLRYLRDRGVVVEAPAGGEWTLSQSVDDIAEGLPESVRSMIQRKIERLEEEDRRLMVAASVQGSAFDSAVLSAALQMDPADVEERLDVLERVHGIVSQVRESTFPDGTPTMRYRFIHVLYQNALYETLRPTRRAALSGAVAQALLALYGDKHASVSSELAYLFEAKRDPARAIDYYLLASQQASRVSAFQEAVQLCRRGLNLVRNLPDTPERLQKELALQVAFSMSLSTLKGYTDPMVEASHVRALALCRETPDSVGTFAALTGLGAFSFMRPSLPDALDVVRRLLRLLEAASIPQMHSWVHFIAGSVKSHMGDLSGGLDHEETAMRSYDPADHIGYLLQFGMDPGIACYAQAGRIAWISGLPDRAQACVDHALDLARLHPHAYTQAFVLYFASILAHYRRDSSRCLQYATELHSVASENAFPMFLGWGDPFYGWAEGENGDLEHGIRRIEQGLEMSRRIGTGLMRPEHQGLLAELLIRRNDLDLAGATLNEAIATSESTSEIYWLPELFRLKAELMLLKSRDLAPDAEATLKKSVDLAVQIRALCLELRSATSLAQLFQELGRAGEARELLSGVYRRFTEGFDTPDLLAASDLLTRLG
jgi:serine/threonine protein kinase/predicted ATPase